MFGISFCVTTDGNNKDTVDRLITNIKSLSVHNYEIIIVGGEHPTFEITDTIKHVPFNETEKPRWITRKKNLAVENSKYDICVIVHDYIIFEQNWYEEFLKFGFDWDTCVHQCLSTNGVRTDGWRVHSYPGLPKYCMIPYDISELVPFMAIQGNYIVIKRGHYLKYPLSELMVNRDPEEMEWSARIISKSWVKCNPNCIVYYGKVTNDDGWLWHLTQMSNYSWFFDQLRAARIEHWKTNENL